MKAITYIIILIVAISCNLKKPKNPTLADIEIQNDSLKTTNNYKLQNNVKEDTLIIKENGVLILIPSEKEIDSLKNIWGEDKFYLVADGQNGYLAAIYKKLDENSINYTVAKNAVIYIMPTKTIVEKRNLPNSWGVLTVSNGAYTFENTLDYTENLDTKSSKSKDKICRIQDKSSNFVYEVLKSYSDNNSYNITIQDRITSKKIQNIEYRSSYLTNNSMECNFVFYNGNKISEGIENYHSFIIADFNFDNLEDFAILWDSGGNGGPKYFYFFQGNNQNFSIAKNFPLEKGSFPKKIDVKNRQLIISNPVGCCEIQTAIYQLKYDNTWNLISSKNQKMK